MNETIELFGEHEVRWYQAAARNAVEQHLENGRKRICVVQATGTGKTLSCGLIFTSNKVRRILGVKKNKPLRLLFIAMKHRLLTQAERAYAHVSNVEFIPHSAFGTLPDETEWDLCVIDEAHHESCMSIQLQLDNLRHKPIIGLTATPERADGFLIKFEEIVEPISREDAVKQGYLAPTSIHSILDGGERSKTEILKKVFDRFAGEMGKTIVFVRTRREVKELSKHLNETGYSCVALLDQKGQDIDRVLDAFSDGEFQFVINCNLISEGVDVKHCESVVIGRQYNSYPQLNQTIGRAARPDSVCNVWELVNPLSGKNLETTAVVGTPEAHRLLEYKRGQWNERVFNYVQNSLSMFGIKKERIVR